MKHAQIHGGRSLRVQNPVERLYGILFQIQSPDKIISGAGGNTGKGNLFIRRQSIEDIVDGAVPADYRQGGRAGEPAEARGKFFGVLLVPEQVRPVWDSQPVQFILKSMPDSETSSGAGSGINEKVIHFPSPFGKISGNAVGWDCTVGRSSSFCLCSGINAQSVQVKFFVAFQVGKLHGDVLSGIYIFHVHDHIHGDFLVCYG